MIDTYQIGQLLYTVLVNASILPTVQDQPEGSPALGSAQPREPFFASPNYRPVVTILHWYPAQWHCRLRILHQACFGPSEGSQAGRAKDTRGVCHGNKGSPFKRASHDTYRAVSWVGNECGLVVDKDWRGDRQEGRQGTQIFTWYLCVYQLRPLQTTDFIPGRGPLASTLEPSQVQRCTHRSDQQGIHKTRSIRVTRKTVPKHCRSPAQTNSHRGQSLGFSNVYHAWVSA